jgi:iron complex transport system substrate-binding protein
MVSISKFFPGVFSYDTMKKLLSIIVFCLITLACRQPTYQYAENVKFSDIPKSVLSYAEVFSIQNTEFYTYLTVFNPWNKDTLSTYLLLKDSVFKNPLPAADFKINLPVEKIACLSSTGIGMLNQLKSGHLISAATDAELIYDSSLFDRFLQGHLENLGKVTNLNTELVIEHNPDLIIKYIYGGKELADSRLRDAGIPIVYHLEFMEPHPLGRAEWIKFLAVFVDQSALADSIFSQIEKTYTYYSSLAKNEEQKPTVLDGSSYKGTWYAAGGLSFPARLYADAGADYYWKNNNQTGSITLSFESIIEKQIDADYWIGASSGSKDELLSIESRYALLKPFKSGNVFYYGKRINPNGGLDYYESGVMRPDILLMDLLWIFHPHLLDINYDPVYLQQIK